MQSPMNPRLMSRQVFAHRPKIVESADVYAKEILLESKLLALVRMRVAHICNCQLCIDVHKEALKDKGESAARIEQLQSWRVSSLYTDRERTALAVSEALGSNPPKPVSKDVVKDARAHFNDAEILQLTLTIFTVNDWSHLCTH